jgi:hypothetical protein
LRGTGTGDPGQSIPAPNKIWNDDFSTPIPGAYNFQTQGAGSVDPSYTNDGPGGEPSLLCPLPTVTAQRSQANFVGGTGFSQQQTFHNINYSYYAEIKVEGDGNSSFRIVSSHQPDGGGINPGTSALVGMQAIFGADRIDMVIDGADDNGNRPVARWVNQDNSPIPVSDIVGKWIKVVVDFRGNHGNRQDAVQFDSNGNITPANGTPTGFRAGFARFYMTIGTENALPPDPTENDLIYAYDGYLGMRHDDGLDRLGYMKLGIYDVSNNSTTSALTFNRVKMQDEVMVTTNPPEGFNT